MSITILNNKLLQKLALAGFASLILNATCVSVAHSQVTPGVAFFVSATPKVNARGSSNSPLLLEIPESNLCETLSYLSQESGIEFKCPGRLEDHVLFPRVIEESNWVSLTRVLLEDYNTIEIWNKNGEMTQVYIVGDKDWNTTTSQQSTGFKSARSNKNNERVKESVAENSMPEDMPGSNLSQSQLFVLLQTSTYRPMPNNIFNSSEFRDVLSFAKIESPQDWLDLKKSSAVKQQVQRLLKLKKTKTEK